MKEIKRFIVLASWSILISQNTISMTQEAGVPMRDTTKKVIIFDLDGVLFKENKPAFIKKVGFGELAKYTLRSWTTPENICLDTLECISKCEDNQPEVPLTHRGRVMPCCIIDWQLGKKSHLQVRKELVVGMEVIADGQDILFATENGYGKKVSVADFRIAHRGGVGVRTIPTDKRNGLVIGLALVHNNSELLLIDEAGKIIRLPGTEVRTMGRQAKGVRLIRLDEGQKLAAMFAFDQTTDGAADGGDTDQSQDGSASSTPVSRLSGMDISDGFLLQPDDVDSLLDMDNVPFDKDDIFAAF
jgi:hypothetical protein